MATYRQVYLIMRARDDATRVMRGLGRSMSHIGKQQEMLAEASRRSQQRYTDAVKGSTAAHKAATQAVKTQSRDARNAINQSTREQNAALRSQGREQALMRTEQNRQAVSNIRNQSQMRLQALRNERDENSQLVKNMTNDTIRQRTNAHEQQVQQIKTARNVQTRAFEAQIHEHRRLSQSYQVRNNQLRTQMATGRIASKEAVRNARIEMTQNDFLRSQHQQRITDLSRLATVEKQNAQDKVDAARLGHTQAIRNERAASEALLQANRARYNQLTQAEQANMRSRLDTQASMYSRMRQQDTSNLNTRLAANQATQQRLLGLEQTTSQRRIAAIDAAHTKAIQSARVENENVQGAVKNYQAYYNRIQEVQGRLVGVGQAALIAGGLIGAAGVAGIRSFDKMIDASAEFSNKNRVAISVAKDFKASIQDVGDAVLSIAREVPVPIEDLQDTLYFTFSAMDVGFNEAIDLVRGFANEAVVGNADIADAARSSIAMINAYAMSVDSAADTTETLTRIQNMQFNTVKWGALTYQDLSTNVGKVIPAAVRAGQEIEQIGGALAFMTRQGLSAEMASTSAARAMELIADSRTISRLEKLGVQVRDLRTKEMRPLNDIVVDFGKHLAGVDTTGIDNMMQALAPLDGDESDKYRNLLVEADKVTKRLSGPERTQALHQIFMGAGNRIQARRFWDLALQNYNEFDRLTKEIINDSDSFGKAVTMAFEEPQVAMEIFDNRLEALKLTIGQELIPIKLKLLEAVTGLIDKWESLDTETKKSLIRATALAAAFAGVGGSVAAIAGVMAIATASMIGLSTAILGANASILAITGLAFGMAVGIPLAIGAVVGAIVLMVIHWDEVKSAVISFGQTVLEWMPVIVASVAGLITMNYAAVAAGMASIAAGVRAVGVAMMTWVVAHPVILAVTVAVGGLIAINRVMGAQARELKAATQDYSNHLWNNREAIMANSGAIKALTREQVINRLESEGLIEAGEKIGLSAKVMTDAILGEAWALKKVDEAVASNVRQQGELIDVWDFSSDSRARQINAANDVAAGIKTETQAIDDSLQSYVDKAEATGELEYAVARLAQIQAQGGPADVNERRMQANHQETVRAAENAAGAIGALPPEYQEMGAAAVEAAGGVNEATIELSDSAKQMQSVLEGIVDPSKSFTAATDNMVEGLRKVHEKALESGDLTDEAFQKIADSATENSTLMVDEWLKGLHEQEREYNEYMNNIEIIIRRGGKDVIDILTDMGDDSVGAVAAMAGSSKEQFEELRRVLSANAEGTSDDTILAMEAMQEGIVNAITDGISDGLFEFNVGMEVFKANAAKGGAATAGELARTLGLGVRDVARIAKKYGIAIAEGVDPVLAAMGAEDRVGVAVKQLRAGDPVTGLQKGGRLSGYGGGDIIPAMLEPGEFVLRKEAVKRLDPQTLHELNNPIGFRAGGFTSLDDVPPVPDYSRHGLVIGGTGRTASTLIRDEAMKFLEENLAPKLGAGIGYQAMFAAISKKFPGTSLISGMRPGAITATGNPSYHGMGRAIDINPVMGIADWIRQHYMGMTKELIFSPMGGRQIRNGRDHMYTGITRSMHWDHIHWAMANGGIVNGPTNALIGEAGPEAVIPLDRLSGLIRDAMQSFTSGTGDLVTAKDQYGNMLGAINALKDQIEAEARLTLARSEVVRLRDELSRLGRETQKATNSLNNAYQSARILAGTQGDIAASLGLSSSLWEEAVEKGKVITLETERGILQQKQRVADLRAEYEKLQNVQSGDQSAEQAKAQADLSYAKFNLAAVSQILPTIDDEVSRLLMQFEAEAMVADAAKALEGLEHTIPTVEELRLAEIDLLLAEKELADLRENAFTRTEDYLEAENKLRELREEMKTTEEGLGDAVKSVTDAEIANMSAIIGLIEATTSLHGLQPGTLAFFREIAKEAGLSTVAIEAQVNAVKSLNTVNTQMARAVAANTGNLGDLEIIKLGSLAAIAQRIKDIFKNRNVSMSAGLKPGESIQQRLERLVSEVHSGGRSFEQIRRSVDLLAVANMATGGIARKRPGGTIVRVGESTKDEAIIPLPKGWDGGSLGGDSIDIDIHEGAVQITFQGPVGDESMDKVREAVDEALSDFVNEFKRDRRAR